MTSKEKIREILSVYHEYAKCYDEDDEWNKVDFNYDDETFCIFEEDVEKAKEIIKDLEILEIFKTIAKRKDTISTALSIEDGRAKTKIIITLDTLNDKEILCNKLIKNWLERKE